MNRRRCAVGLWSVMLLSMIVGPSPATAHFVWVEADAIAPFPVSEMLRYRPQYLAGWLAEEYSVDRDQAEIAHEAGEVRAQDQLALAQPDGFCGHPCH